MGRNFFRRRHPSVDQRPSVYHVANIDQRWLSNENERRWKTTRADFRRHHLHFQHDRSRKWVKGSSLRIFWLLIPSSLHWRQRRSAYGQQPSHRHHFMEHLLRTVRPLNDRKKIILILLIPADIPTCTLGHHPSVIGSCATSSKRKFFHFISLYFLRFSIFLFNNKFDLSKCSLSTKLSSSSSSSSINHPNLGHKLWEGKWRMFWNVFFDWKILLKLYK